MEGSRQGHGVFKGGGIKYEGQWLSGVRHGQGRVSSSSGHEYEGEFVEDAAVGGAVRAVAQVDAWEPPEEPAPSKGKAKKKPPAKVRPP